MKAKVRTTQQVINAVCIDGDSAVQTWKDIDTGDLYLDGELDFEDLTDYKSWTENLIHDLAVEAYRFQDGDVISPEERKRLANEVVLFAYEVTDRMMQESKTWR